MESDKTNYFLPHETLQDMILALNAAGYTCIGPKAKDGAIVYENLENAKELPWSIRDKQSPGEYKLEKIPEHKAFAFSNGAEAIKPILFKPRETVWRVARNDDGKLVFEPHTPKEKPIAIFGARACDISAMLIQDKVFIEGPSIDKRYEKRRNALFIIGVNCTYSSQNCFCVSAGTGPEIKNTYDVVMTEIQDGFVISTGSKKGAVIIDKLNLKTSQAQECESAKKNIKQAAKMQTKKIPFNNSSSLKDLLFSNLEHDRWAEVADRCLSCGNCTSVCPTCFCNSEVEKPSLDGKTSEHQTEWDSCFTAGHSYLNGKLVRDDTSQRYRQWLTHKVGSWFDQFDTSGCVGCGRCVSWCPVGIDLTEELAAISGESNIRETDEE